MSGRNIALNAGVVKRTADEHQLEQAVVAKAASALRVKSAHQGLLDHELRLARLEKLLTATANKGTTP